MTVADLYVEHLQRLRVGKSAARASLRWRALLNRMLRQRRSSFSIHAENTERWGAAPTPSASFSPPEHVGSSFLHSLCDEKDPIAQS